MCYLVEVMLLVTDCCCVMCSGGYVTLVTDCCCVVCNGGYVTGDRLVLCNV